MGLDIYAGTLTRYYSHNWKTVVQQWAEENGYTFNRITPDGEPADNEEELSPAEIQAAVEDWRDQILAAISQPNQPPYTPWPEDNERPYYTDKPDWDAFGAMLLVAACHTYEEPVPLTVEKDWDFGEHPLIARLASDEERVWSLLRGATWWLPLTDSFLFQGPLPTDDQTMIATLGGLRKELEKLNQLDAEFQDVVAHAVRKTMVFADRFPLRYFAEAYGLDYYAAYPGCADAAEPSAATVAFLIDKVRAENIPVVFTIELSNGKLADTICEATGAKKLEFATCHNATAQAFADGATYLQLMERNVQALREALN